MPRHGCSIAIGLISVLIPTAATRAQLAERGKWELTLAGIGASDKDFNNNAFGLSAGLGYFVIDNVELSLRQTVVYVNAADTTTDASTVGALDLHFPLGDGGRIQPFIGGNVGFFYGDTSPDALEYGPEAGVKYFLNTTTFIYFRAEYQVYSQSGHNGGNSSDDQQYVFGLGIGFRF